MIISALARVYISISKLTPYMNLGETGFDNAKLTDLTHVHWWTFELAVLHSNTSELLWLLFLDIKLIQGYCIQLTSAKNASHLATESVRQTINCCHLCYSMKHMVMTNTDIQFCCHQFDRSVGCQLCDDLWTN